MLRSISFVSLFTFVVIFVSCSNQKNSANKDGKLIQNPAYGTLQDEANPPFELNLIETIKLDLPDEIILSGFNSMVTDFNGNIYFMDRRQNKLLSVSSDGRIRWITGEEGRGPGDFEDAYSMVTNGEYLYVGNLQGSRMDLFDFEGNFLKSHNLEGSISFGSFTGFTDSGQLVVSTPNWDKWGHKLFVLQLSEDSVSVMESFTIDQSGDVETAQGITTRASLKVSKSKLYSGSITDYSYEVYSLSGALETRIERDFDKIVRPGMLVSGNSRSLRMFGGVNAPIPVSDEHLLVTAQWPTNVSDPDQYMKKSNNGTAPDIEYENTIDIFATGGTLLYSIEGEGFNPEIGNILHVDENGIIYTAEVTPDPVIKKYQLIQNSS